MKKRVLKEHYLIDEYERSMKGFIYLFYCSQFHKQFKCFEMCILINWLAKFYRGIHLLTLAFLCTICNECE